MKSLSGVGLAMSVVFGFLLMALLAELYYLLWWKRRITNARIEDGTAKEFFFMFCGKNPSSSLTSDAMKPQEISMPDNLVRHERQPSTNRGEEEEEEQSMEAELMRLSGPARFLCTIKEETMEDLESDDSKCRDDENNKCRKGTPFLEAVETPFLTPLASPPYYTPPLTPASQLQESRIDMMMTEDSPPPSFKFLRDAEEKAHHHQNRKDNEETSSSEEELPYKDEENGSFITLVFPRSREGEFVSQFPSISSSSQVLPLASSPPSLISPPNK